ncbi:AraC family transcriptional regulator [Mangrovibacterium lignilyticum]|uniref:AraC family transcriptional regulator n=1 Tax=Mangrovibacterium lignilyticum TaxID=2668052 RepID=UPI0013D4ED10|nr:AraC family transcriptional regulator [Mangrovibacterium lignilyticum]
MKQPTSIIEQINRYDESFFVINSEIERQFPMHTHNKHQMYYLENGIAFFNTPENSFFLPAHHFLWIPAGLEHNISPRTLVKMVHNVYIPSALIGSNKKLEERAGVYPVTNLLVEMINYINDWNGDITSDQTEKYQFLITLANVIVEAAKVPIPIELPTTQNENLRVILRHIHHHIEQPLKLEQLAEEYGYSTRSLSRLFQQNINTSFLQYVKLLRIIKAMELLLQTDLSISEISYRSGYNSLSSFSFAFQKVVRSSPAEFRKRTRQI